MSIVRGRKSIKSSNRIIASFAIACLFTSYFGQKFLNWENKHNFYILLELESTTFTKAELQKAYRNASKKYHPDKNLEIDTTDKFIEIKTAQEILENPFTRSSYDLFGQTRFDQENQLYQVLQTQFNVENPEEFQAMNDMFWSHIKQKRIVSSLSEVLPYYVAWIVAGLMMIDRSYGKPAMALLCAGMCAFEILARINYGVEDYESMFNMYKQFFPQMWTMGECLKLTRECFPLLLVVLICLLDNSVDKLNLDDDKSHKIALILLRQNKILKMCKDAGNNSAGMEEGERRDKYIREEVAKIQKEILEYSKGELMDGVGETIETLESKESQEGMLSKVMKGAMTIMLALSVFSYTLEPLMSNKTKK